MFKKITLNIISAFLCLSTILPLNMVVVIAEETNISDENSNEIIKINSENTEEFLDDVLIIQTPSDITVDEAEEQTIELQEEVEEVQTEEVESETIKEVNMPEFNDFIVVDGVQINVSAPDGVFPENSTLSVEKVLYYVQNQVDNVLDEVRNEEANVVASYTFDIKILDSEGNEIQPKDGSKVKVSFTLAEASNENLDTNVYHIDDKQEEITSDNVKTLDVVTEGEEVIVETDGFSIYTVEFTYNNKEYVLEGDTYVRLSDILDFVGLAGEVESWEVSNPSLFNIFRGTEDEVSYDYEIIDEYIYDLPIDNPDGDVLYIVPLQMFNTEEWLKVTIDGIEYEIKVTDDNIYQTVPSSYTGNISTNNDDNLAITGDTYFLDAPKPDYVMQSQSTTSARDFAAGLPLSTIFIDVDKIGHIGNTGVQGEFKLLTENEAIRAGFEHYYNNDEELGELKGDVVRYNPLADTENLMQIEPNKINVLEGDLFQFTFKNAAILPNGSRAHVRMIYSNAKIAVDQRLGVTDAASGLTASNYQGKINLAVGGTVNRGGTDERYVGWTSRTSEQEPNQPFTQAQKRAMVNAINSTISENWGESYTTSSLNGAPTPVLGQSIDVKYQVVDDDENPIDGTFIFAVTGINLDRDPYAVSGNNTGKPLWTYNTDDSDLHFFSEAMSINNGKVSDYIYVRPNTNVFESDELKQQAEASNPPSKKLSYYYAQVIEDSNGNVKFIGNGYNPSSLGGNDLSYNSGFVVLANAKDGITITSTGHATSRLGMNTQAWGGVQIWYRYTSSTGPNGNIQTTSEGNYGGTLDDTSDHEVSSNILDPNTFVVPEGKTVTYTLTPDTDYQIAKLQVANANGTMREIKYNGNKPLFSMQEGDTYRFNDAAGRQCVLTALADGKFTLEVPYATHDEKFHVEWRRNNASVKIKKDTVDNKEGTFTFNIKAYKKEDVTTYSPVEIGSIWKSPETGNYEMTLVSGATTNLTADDIATILANATIDTKHFITGVEYTWGAYLGKTNINLSDIDITYGEDDVLFVGFENLPSALIGDSVGQPLNIGYSAAGSERIYLYHPSTNVENDVMTYWNFNTLEGQSSNPGWYTFTVDAGEEEELTIQEGYTYEVREINDANWQLLDIDGNPIQTASGELTSENRNPSHDFLNREVPDLTIKKETVNDAPGTFEFKIKVWQGEETTKTKTIYKLQNPYIHTSTGWWGWSDVNDYASTLNDSDFTTLLMGEDISDKDAFGSDVWQSEYFDENTTFKYFTWDTENAYTGDPITLKMIKITYTKNNGEVVDYYDCVTEEQEVTESNIEYMDLSEQFGEPDEDGYYHFTLNNDGSLTIPNLPYGCKYEVIEVEQDGWRLTNKINDSGSLEENTTAKFTNEKLLSLTIKKEADEDTGEEFEFGVRIFNWQKIYSATTNHESNTSMSKKLIMENIQWRDADTLESYFENGYEEFKFVRNETENLYGLGYYWDEYSSEFVNEHSVTTFDGYIEEYTSIPDSFPMYLNNTLQDGDKLDIYVYLSQKNIFNDKGQSISYDNDLDMNIFTLKSGESIELVDIPYGSEYEIYELDSEGNEVAIGDVFDTKWTLKSATNTSGTLGETTTSVFTNEIKRGSINIKKETKGNEEGEFNFKAKVWKQVPGTDVYDLTEQLGDIGDDGYYEFTLNNGENLKIDNIPFGYKYEVYEIIDDNWAFVSVDGLTSEPKVSGTINNWYSCTITKHDDPDYTSEPCPPYMVDGYEHKEHLFINAKKHDLTVEKKVTGNMGDKSRRFEFEILLDTYKTEEPDITYRVIFNSDGTIMMGNSDGGLRATKERLDELFDSGNKINNTSYVTYKDYYSIISPPQTGNGWSQVPEEPQEPLDFTVIIRKYEMSDGKTAYEITQIDTVYKPYDIQIDKVLFEKDIYSSNEEIEFYRNKLIQRYGEERIVDSVDEISDGEIYIRTYGNPQIQETRTKFVMLSHGSKIEFKDLPYGILYHITETSDHLKEGYSTKVDGKTASCKNEPFIYPIINGEIEDEFKVPKSLVDIYGEEDLLETLHSMFGEDAEIEFIEGYEYECEDNLSVFGELTEDKSHLFENRNQAAVPTEIRIAQFGVISLIILGILFIIKKKKPLVN